MSQELERVYTINLGKAWISVDTHRATRSINMIKEFARHHMKIEDVKIEEDLAHQIWARGAKHPPRKIRVRMTKTDEGYVLISRFDDEAESEISLEKDKKSIEEKIEPTLKESAPEELDVEAPKKEAPKKEAPKKEAPKKEAPKKEAPKKEAPKKESNKKK